MARPGQLQSSLFAANREAGSGWIHQQGHWTKQAGEDVGGANPGFFTLLPIRTSIGRSN